MLFNTWTFLVFALVVFGLYYVLPFRWQNRMLLVASYIFYGAWDWRFLSLIFLTTVIDFWVGRLLGREENPHRRKRWIVLSCVTNLGLLGVFKYLGFFADSFARLAARFGWEVDPLTLDLVLPVGISFYTFQSMSYTIDVYRRDLAPVRKFEDFALFVAYFPQLVAGPIERATHLVPQLMRPRTLKRDQIMEGAWLVLWGLFKKAVIADNIAPRVDEVFLLSNDWASGGVRLVAIYGFAIQIYCDFSGYSDVARGLGKLMGIDIMRNFQIPYVATNPQEFWHRWHISFSTWLRDYLYIPLGGNRGGVGRTYRNLVLTMVLGGLWHGAAWTFVVWGIYQGLLLVVHRWVVVEHKLPQRFARMWRTGPRPSAEGTRATAKAQSGALETDGGRAPAPTPAGLSPKRIVERFLSWLLMFHLICLGWLIFRAGSMAQVRDFLVRIVTDFRLDSSEVHIVWPIVFFGVILFSFDYWLRNTDDPRTRPGWSRGLGPIAVTALLVLALIFWPPRIQQFIYFQF